MRLLVLGCSVTKRPVAGLLPAIDRYDGPAYRLLRTFLRVHHDQQGALDILILSAQFGLIIADHRIPDYDRRMDAGRAIELRPQVHEQAQALLAGRSSYAATCINLGKTYTAALAWPDISTALGGPVRFGTVTFAAGGIGQRLGQLKRWLEAGDG